jgi:STE24 endopeptidase
VNSLDFSQEDVERGSRYHRPLYLAFAVRLLILVGVYSLLARTWIGGGLGWAGGAALWAALVVVAAEVACLPLDLWRGLAHERAWGFSTESTAAWLGDRAKSAAIAIVLAAGSWTAVVALARALPGWWAVPAAAALALLVLTLAFIGPAVLEPLFNRFGPLADEGLAADLRGLAAAAGVPVRNVLVADASRRTTKLNAYVSGLGATRRVVLFDTLLDAADEREIKLVVAHELGHRRDRHVVKGTLLAMLGAVLAVVLLWAVLGTPEPRDAPLALLLLIGLELAGLPVFALVSRRWERAADRCSLELTEDREAFERAHVELARKNLSDLEPPRLVYLMLFTHPTPQERLALARGNLISSRLQSSERLQPG